MITCDARSSRKTEYSVIDAVLQEIDRYKQGLPGLLKELEQGDAGQLRLIGGSEFRRRPTR